MWNWIMIMESHMQKSKDIASETLHFMCNVTKLTSPWLDNPQDHNHKINFNENDKISINLNKLE
jgi:hypothetical protein